MDIEILNLFHQGFSECYIANKLGISYKEVIYVLDYYYNSWVYDDYDDDYIEY